MLFRNPKGNRDYKLSWVLKNGLTCSTTVTDVNPIEMDKIRAVIEKAFHDPAPTGFLIFNSNYIRLSELSQVTIT